MGSNFEWSPEKGWLFLQILSPLTGPSSFFLCSELTLKKKNSITHLVGEPPVWATKNLGSW